MEEISSWVAPIATAIAACMTASNLGARVTGWGFIVFTVGSIAWTTYGAATGQTNLVWQNIFLTLVNMVGIWRWLGRQAKLDDGARAASEQSEAEPVPTLFPASTLTSARLESRSGDTLGAAVDAMIRCNDGSIAYLVVGKGGVGGIGETLHALPWQAVKLEPGRIVADIDPAALERLEPIDPRNWPAEPQPV
ncbi:PRC-barrel domain-containing protein [Sphingomonas sp.]|uniref:PRC-barrel domain-containing protein n=1 Tax=Sphingomonas sp. TaxID=28214 RepID=UPI002E124AA1